MKGSTMELNLNRKRSVIVYKRRTSISMEDSFWLSLQAIVRMEGITIGDFVEKISQQRSTLNLSSSLRVAVLEYFQRLAANSIAIRGDMEAPLQPDSANGAHQESGPGDQQQILERIASFSRRVKHLRAPLAHIAHEMARENP
jgi:predicted DNA-binding ribbon-helix-helix protein